MLSHIREEQARNSCLLRHLDVPEEVVLTRVQQALGGILEYSYLRQHLHLIKDSTNGKISGNEDIFACMRYCKNLLDNGMFAEPDNHKLYVRDTLVHFDGRNKTFNSVIERHIVITVLERHSAIPRC